MAFDNNKKNAYTGKKNGISKADKLAMQKAEAAQRYATPPPSFCLGVKK